MSKVSPFRQAVTRLVMGKWITPRQALVVLDREGSTDCDGNERTVIGAMDALGLWQLGGNRTRATWLSSEELWRTEGRFL